MTVSDQQIVDAFNEREEAAGGRIMADQKAILRETAEALGVPYERARDAILWHWGAAG